MKTRKQIFQLLPFRARFEAALWAICLLAGAVVMVGLSANHSPLKTPFVVLSILALSAAGWFSQRYSTVTFGADGFFVHRLRPGRFVAWKDFVRFEKTRRGIVAHTTSGKVPIGRRLLARNEDAVLSLRPQAESIQSLKDAAESWQQPRAKPRLLQLLEGQPQDEWPAILKRAGDYRTSGISQAQFLQDLLHPETPPELRELIAKTVKIRVEDGDDDEVRQTVEVFASERSQKVLRSLLDEAD